MIYYIRSLIIALLFSLIASVSYSQTYNPFNQRDDTYRLLGLKRAKQAYETSQTEFNRTQQLFEQGLISQIDYEKARNQFTDAEVNYQQSLLAVLFEEQYISVSRAVKYQASDGSKRVRLTIVNTSGGSAEYSKLINVDDELFRTLQPDVIPNIYVSVLNNENAIISNPYETKISELRYGNPVEVDFALLQDLDEVSIFMIYGNGNQRTMKVFLQKDQSVDRVVVQSEQFSQEIELGSKSSFDLSLELFSGSTNMFALEVVNLPSQIGRFFKDKSGQVRLTQVKFTESSRAKKAALEISLPDRPNDLVRMNEPIPFYVLVIPRDRLRQIKDIRTRHWTESEIKELNIGYVQLEVLPRGKGKLRAQIRLLYQSIEAGSSANIAMDVLNEGSDRLDNIEVRVDLPLNWTKEISPSSISSLEIAKDKRVELTFYPPDDVAPGKYNIRVRTSGASNGEPVSAEDKTITIEIQSETSLLGTLIILISVLALIVGVVVYGIRLSRK